MRGYFNIRGYWKDDRGEVREIMKTPLTSCKVTIVNYKK